MGMSFFCSNFVAGMLLKTKQINYMKKIAILMTGMLFGLYAMAQSDPVIMKINGKNITRSEFEYSFNKNNSDGVLDKKTVEEYVPLYVDFKLKVAAAQEAGIDTITSIRKELRGYKEQMILPELVDSSFIEREAKKTYDATAARFAGQDLLDASHILVFMRQDATEEQQAAAKTRIDSIYTALKNGADFATLAKECSEDKGSAVRGGELGQFGKGMMIPDFENAAYALKPGQISEPVKSTVGWHIIKLNDRHPFEPYEFHHDNIIKFLEQRGIKEASANAYIDSLAKQRNVSRDEMVDILHNDITAKDPELKNLAQEYYDGTLMYEVSKNNVWDKAQKDEAGQEAFFKAHQKDYTWDSPRFCGIVIHAKDKATLDASKKVLKKVKNEEDWAKTLVSTFNNDSVKMVRIERGIFKKGDNANVDALSFKTGAELKPMKDYPETGIFGKQAKKPRSYKDVKGQVTTDYQNQEEKKWVEQLRAKYPVEIYEDVVKTVNNH